MCRRVVPYMFMLLILSCAGKEIKTVSDAKESYDYAMKMLKSGRYLQARETFQEIKNKLPDSSYAVLSELRIADSYYEEESYPEAISSYEVFEELHPGHAKREYVIYQIGKSHFKDTPDAIDRDLEPARKAVREFKRLLTLFPNTKYKNEVLKNIHDLREKLMRKEYYIARYYMKRDKFKAASVRYEEIISNYKDLKGGTLRETLSDLLRAYKKLKDSKNIARVEKIKKELFPSK